MIVGSLFIVLFSSFTLLVTAREVLELQAVNFELALTSYKYVAILFYDNSDYGKKLEQEWLKAAAALDNLHSDGEVAKVGQVEQCQMNVVTSCCPDKWC